MTMVMIVIGLMRAVQVTALQLFLQKRFADGDDFHIKLQVLASQHGCHQPQRGRLQLQ